MWLHKLESRQLQAQCYSHINIVDFLLLFKALPHLNSVIRDSSKLDPICKGLSAEKRLELGPSVGTELELGQADPISNRNVQTFLPKVSQCL